ncbi:hypothetical protein LWI29_035950 [Acer saccharum]|uniref:Uncharacterized protein n=1 Tax=Acer saccharum TaxID=4024 RepID=A0AA39RJ26_ACESA|nr:hypothetical protein LWI29_035950 [Acer saccharum]
MGGGGGGELRYEILQNAYIKLVLYARKHKTAAVNGVLVGRVSPQKNDVVEITDSVPRLSPVMKHNISRFWMEGLVSCFPNNHTLALA